MGKLAIIFGIWAVGFILGFGGYLASPSIGKFLMDTLPQIFVSEALVGSFISGLASSIITVVSVIVWVRMSRSA